MLAGQLMIIIMTSHHLVGLLLLIIAAHHLVGLLLLIIMPLDLVVGLRRVTISEMHKEGIWPTASWLYTTTSALPLEFHRSCGVTSSPPEHRLGPSILPRRASLPTTLIGRIMWVRAL